MNDLEKYFNRVLPVIGRELENKKIAFLNLEQTHRLADAFARCGTRKMVFIDSRQITADSAFVLSYGKQYIGKSADEAMKEIITNHNKLIDDWDIIGTEEIRGVDLIVGAGNIQEYASILEQARILKIPVVFFMVLNGLPINSLLMIQHPDIPYSGDIISKISQNNIISAEVGLNFRLSWLEISDLAMNCAKALLLRGTKYQRDDIEDLFFRQQKNVVLRGQAEWPWWVYYLKPKEKEKYLSQVFNTKYFVPYPPVQTICDKKVMLIGCGTGSLIAGELINYFRNLLFVDYKMFSIFNPTRQLVGTDYINFFKPLAIIYYCENKINLDLKQKFVSPFIISYEKDDYTLGASCFKITQQKQKSIEIFHKLLDDFQPDLVIVGMGRALDDNYTVCEILRKRGIKHIIPTAFPEATHYKTIVVDGTGGPCYECIRGNTALDYSDGIVMNEEAREMFYSDRDDPIQPATIFETWPSANNTLRLSIELLLEPELRSLWFNKCMAQEQTCFVGANMVSQTDAGFAYGVAFPGQVVVYGMNDLLRVDEDIYQCPTCGKKYFVTRVLKI